MTKHGGTSMSEQMGSIAVLPNVVALQTLVLQVLNRHIDLPGMATFYGPSGNGKSMAAQYVAHNHDAVLVECKSLWTKKEMLIAMLKELGLPAKGTLNAMAELVAETLILEDKVLIIDEADYLVKKNMIEVVRDIHQASKAPVILIGEELLPQKLRAWERIHNRMLGWVRAEEGSLHELRLLSRIYAPGLTLSASLEQRILQESACNIRRICVNLNRIAEAAATNGITELAESDWGKLEFFTGEAPQQIGQIKRVGGHS